jgi:hypothetical protein
MNVFATPERPPTPRERAYLEALGRGERWPSISGHAGKMCRRFGWCEAVFVGPDGTEVLHSALSGDLDSIGIVKAGYRLVGYALTERGRRAMGG